MANHFVNLAQQNFQQLKPEQQQKMRRFLTPQFATIAGVLFGDEVSDLVNSIGDSSMQSVPMPKKAVQFIGEDKLNKIIQKAVEDAAALEQEQMAAQPQSGGFAAPQQAQQQAPVSPPAPTGFTDRPQLPLPANSGVGNAVANQPIR